MNESQHTQRKALIMKLHRLQARQIFTLIKRAVYITAVAYAALIVYVCSIAMLSYFASNTDLALQFFGGLFALLSVYITLVTFLINAAQRQTRQDVRSLFSTLYELLRVTAITFVLILFVSIPNEFFENVVHLAKKTMEKPLSEKFVKDPLYRYPNDMSPIIASFFYFVLGDFPGYTTLKFAAIPLVLLLLLYIFICLQQIDSNVRLFLLTPTNAGFSSKNGQEKKGKGK